MNRTYALAQAKGKHIALKEALKIKLDGNHLYHFLLAELYTTINQQKVSDHLELAITFCSNKNDLALLNRKLSKFKVVSSRKI